MEKPLKVIIETNLGWLDEEQLEEIVEGVKKIQQEHNICCTLVVKTN